VSESPLMTVAEVAELLGWSRARGYRSVAEGLIPHTRLSSGRIVVPRAAFEAWLEAQTIAALANVKTPDAP